MYVLIERNDFLLACFFLATSKYIPRYAELDEEDKVLFRAAYDTPTYDHDEYQETEDLPIGKLDLVKDGMWALKAKIKELKAFDKALAANMLSTKLKLKDLLESSKVIKKHHHVEPTYEHKKPYGYQVSKINLYKYKCHFVSFFFLLLMFKMNS